ncbi:hypothetical protein GWI33_000880 [Rhynchophorus ferrugineus]|uniref:Uncharacterized protein n=1 Tax=Rhynchophorus ferrugineus TaxID=354439 RepID=A0A834ISW7_RHYFE|nr:hypothetical protein GWI33_000880 [Rhynchophorus ferrugineus]
MALTMNRTVDVTHIHKCAYFSALAPMVDEKKKSERERRKKWAHYQTEPDTSSPFLALILPLPHRAPGRGY